MAESVFHKYFGKDFTGINAECSAIELEGGEVNRAVNLEWALSNNLRGRTGRQLVGAPVNAFGIHSHNYSLTLPKYDVVYNNTAPKIQSTSRASGSIYGSPTGETVSEIVCINSQFWRLENRNYKVTIAAGGDGDYSWWTYVGSGVAGSGPTKGNIYFKLQKNNVDVTGFGTSTNGYDCGTGLEVPGSGLKTIYDLMGAIDATADLTCTRDRASIGPFALGTTGVGAYFGTSDLGNVYPFNVSNTPYTFEYGDHIVYWNSLYGLVGGWVSTLVDVTTIRVVIPSQLQFNNAQVLGYSGMPAASFPIQTKQTFSGVAGNTFNITFPTWVWVPTPLKLGTGAAAITNPLLSPFNCSRQKYTNQHYKPPSLNSQNGVCYVCATNAINSSDYMVKNSGKVYKYDTQAFYGAGWPPLSIQTVTTGGGAFTAGTYKYKYYFRRVDSQGNYIESDASPVYTYVSNGAAGTQPTLTIQSMFLDTTTYALSQYGWYNCYAQRQLGVGNQTIGTGTIRGPIQVCARSGTTGRPLLNLGDPICFKDSLDRLHRTYIVQIDQSTFTTHTQIYVADEAAYTSASYDVTELTQFTSGVTAVLLRTTNGGNQFYQLTEKPIAYYDIATTPLTYTDDTATMPDSTLITRTRYTEIEIGKEHNLPPPSTLLCEHQGMQIYSGNPNQPNTIAYSLPGEPEYVPLATNNFDVPSTQKGAVSAIISDGPNHLAVFKEQAYYDVQGDLDSGAIDPQVRAEGDYGITSHKTLVRANGIIYGLSKLGVIAISQGSLDVQITRKLNARMINQPWYFRWATAVNDPGTRAYVLTIPKTLDTNSNVTSNTYVIDYSREQISFLEQAFSAGFNPSGGSASLGGNDLYQLSFDQVSGLSTSPVGVVSSRIQRFINNSPTGADGLCFNDGGQAIEYILETQPINKGEPSLLKTLIRGRLFSIPNDYIAEGWVPFDSKVEVGVFPDATYIGDVNNGGSVINPLSFTSIINWFKDFQPKPVNAFCYLLRFTTATLFQAPFFTGYELVFKAPEAKEDLQKP